MRVQHEAIAIGRKCIVTKNVVLYNKECGKCPVSVEGGVLMCYVSSVGWKVSWAMLVLVAEWRGPKSQPQL